MRRWPRSRAPEDVHHWGQVPVVREVEVAHDGADLRLVVAVDLDAAVGRRRWRAAARAPESKASTASQRKRSGEARAQGAQREPGELDDEPAVGCLITPGTSRGHRYHGNPGGRKRPLELPDRSVEAPLPSAALRRERLAGSRLSFFRGATLAGWASSTGASSAAAPRPCAGWGPLAGSPRGGSAAEPPRVRRRVTLGRTGLAIPDIGFGSSRLAGDEALVRHALDRGINYFDTAESYTGGASEETLGRALRGMRDKVHAREQDRRRRRTTARRPVPRARGQPAPAADRSHRRLLQPRRERRRAARRTPSGTSSPSARSSRARSASRGMSGHGGRLVECLDYAFDHDLVDVVLVAHNFGQDPAFYSASRASSTSSPCSPSCRACSRRRSEKNVGVRRDEDAARRALNDLRPYETRRRHVRAGRVPLGARRRHVDALVVTMTDASRSTSTSARRAGQAPARARPRAARALRARNGATQCRYGCGACARAARRACRSTRCCARACTPRTTATAALARAEYAALGAGATRVPHLPAQRVHRRVPARALDPGALASGGAARGLTLRRKAVPARARKDAAILVVQGDVDEGGSAGGATRPRTRS